MERVLRLIRSKFQLTEQEGLEVVISDAMFQVFPGGKGIMEDDNQSQCSDRGVQGFVAAKGKCGGYGNHRMREELGVALGRFVMVDYDIEDSCVGEFMRIKVSLDVFQPLHKEMQVRLSASE
ncbi:hypothetical protein ACFX13_035359 [Malus domestica]